MMVGAADEMDVEEAIQLSTEESGEFIEPPLRSSTPDGSNYASSELSDLSIMSSTLPLVYLDDIVGEAGNVLMTVIHQSLAEMPSVSTIPTPALTSVVNNEASLIVSFALDDISEGITDAESLAAAVNLVSLQETPVTTSPAASSPSVRTMKGMTSMASRRRFFICGKCQFMAHSSTEAEAHARRCLAPRDECFNEHDIRIVLFDVAPVVVACQHCSTYRQVKAQVILAHHEYLCSLEPTPTGGFSNPFIPPGNEWEQYEGTLYAPTYYTDLLARLQVEGDWCAIEHQFLADSLYWRWVVPYHHDVPAQSRQHLARKEHSPIRPEPREERPSEESVQGGACGDGPAPVGPRRGRQARQRKARRRRYDERLLASSTWPANVARVSPQAKSGWATLGLHRSNSWISEDRAQGMLWSIHQKTFVGQLTVQGVFKHGNCICWPTSEPAIRNLLFFQAAPLSSQRGQSSPKIPEHQMERATAIVLLINPATHWPAGVLMWQSDLRNIRQHMSTASDDTYRVNPGCYSVRLQYTELPPTVSRRLCETISD